MIHYFKVNLAKKISIMDTSIFERKIFFEVPRIWYMSIVVLHGPAWTVLHCTGPDYN